MTIAHVALFAVVSTIIHLLAFVLFAKRAPAPALVLAGSVVSVSVYQLWVYVDLGVLDPFFAIAAAVQFGVALVIGFLVAAIFRSTKAGERAG